MMAPEWIVALVVLLPLLAAVVPVVAGTRYPRAGWYVAAVALGITLALALLLAISVYVSGFVRYEVGAIPVPYGVELYADAFSVTIVLLDVLLALGVLVYTRTAGPHGNSFYSCYLLLTGSIIGIAMTEPII